MRITKNQLRKIIREVLDEEESIGVKVEHWIVTGKHQIPSCQ